MGGWSVWASFGTERISSGDWPLEITVDTSGIETSDGPVHPSATVDGHPAQTLHGVDGGEGLRVFDIGGIYAEMLTHSAEATGALPDGLVGVFRDLDLRREPAHWHSAAR